MSLGEQPSQIPSIRSHALRQKSSRTIQSKLGSRHGLQDPPRSLAGRNRTPSVAYTLAGAASGAGCGGCSLHVRPASRVYRTWGMDSRRWEGFRPRPDDIVIATYPKCGTTWMQRIVSLLVFQDPDPIRLMDVSPWMDCRFVEPVETTLAGWRRPDTAGSSRATCPATAAFFDELRYIVVARHGRDACLSYHNHVLSYTPWMLARLDAAGVEDGTAPSASADRGGGFLAPLAGARDIVGARRPAAALLLWVPTLMVAAAQPPKYSIAALCRSEGRPCGPMRRVADFLEIDVPASVWPELIEATGFQAMRRAGDTLLGETGAAFRGGGDTFFHHGENGRWHGQLDNADLRLYEAKAAALPADCTRWLTAGSADVSPDRLAGPYRSQGRLAPSKPGRGVKGTVASAARSAETHSPEAPMIDDPALAPRNPENTDAADYSNTSKDRRTGSRATSR